MNEICSHCGAPIHWTSVDGGSWYHDRPIDTLACDADAIEPATVRI